MAEEKIIIRFDAKGDKGLRAAVRKLDNDMRKLQGKQKNTMMKQFYALKTTDF